MAQAEPLTKNEKNDPAVESDEGSSSSESSDGEGDFLTNLKRFVDAIKAMISRQLFLLHALLALWRVTKIRDEEYWLMALTLVLLLAETVIVLWRRRGREWDWFQFGVFFYIISVVPPIWILELTKLGILELKNATDQNVSLSEEDRSDPTNVFKALGHEYWLLGLEQSLLVVVIVSRWLIPKGHLTREQLSSLLLLQLGTASDIVDFFVVLPEGLNIKIDNKEGNDTDEERKIIFIYMVLGVWSASLLQFPIVVTARKDDALDTHDAAAALMLTGVAKGQETEEAQQKKALKTFGRVLMETDAWGVFVSLVLQDVPFLFSRVVIIYHFNITTYSIVFFTCKNLLVVSLQIYRVISLYVEHRKRRKEEKVKKKQEFVSFLKDILHTAPG